MKGNETAAPVRGFDRAYINGQFVTPHGTQVVDLVNPTNNRVIGKRMKSTPETLSAPRKRPSIRSRKAARNTRWNACSAYMMP
jgi:hypothetical protein